MASSMAVVPNRFGIYPLVEGPGRHVYPKTTTFCLVLGFTPSREACRAHQSQNDLEQLSPERPGAASGRGGDVGEAKGAWAKGSAWGAEKVVGRRGVGVGCQCARGERRVGRRGTRPWERARAPAKAAGEGSRPHRGGGAASGVVSAGEGGLPGRSRGGGCG